MDVRKTAVTITGFTIQDKLFIKWLQVKTVEQSTSSRCILTEDDVLKGRDTFDKISVRSLTMSISTFVQAMCSPHAMVNNATVGIFSIQCFCLPNFILCHETSQLSMLRPTCLLTHNHLTNCLSSSVNPTVATALLLDVQFTQSSQWIILRPTE